MKEELTEHQRKALQYATKEWFNPELCNNEFFFRVRRPYFTATKLYEKGYLERKVTGPEGMPYFVFRLAPDEEKIEDVHKGCQKQGVVSLMLDSMGGGLSKESERIQKIHKKECQKHGVGQLDADEYYKETE